MGGTMVGENLGIEVLVVVGGIGVGDEDGGQAIEGNFA